MSFDADWLALREPADRAARDPGLLAAAKALLGDDGLAVDLGCGTGATVRAFGGAGRWRLVDRDPRLLSEALARCPGAEAVRADLALLAEVPIEGAALVTASALLDLVSADWVEALAERLAAAGVGFYAALSVDGTLAWEPPLPGDAAVAAAFARDQGRDKGFGPALGPAAPEAVARAFRRHGYSVRTAASPWRLGPEMAALQVAFLEGVAQAAGPEADAWLQARRASSSVSRSIVGHVDVLAVSSAQSKTTSLSRP